MIARTIVLIIAFSTLALLAYALYSGSGEVNMFLLVAMGACLVLIFEDIRTYHRFTLQEKTLIVKTPFHQTTLVNIDQIIRWKEVSFFIRGQEKKSIVLLISFDRKITITNNDFPAEYDKVARYLNTNHSNLRHLL